MAKLVMGYWDCPVCGSKGIRGDVQNCPSCGRARGDVKFYMKNYTEGEIREENERGDIEYLSEEEAKYVSNNPDWYCSFCDSLNSDNAEYCSNCGASRKDSESNYFDQLKKRKEREEAELAAQPQTQSQAPRKRSKWPLLILALIIGFIIYSLIPKTAKDLKITGFSWARNIQIEQNQQVQYSDWTLPANAELIEQRQELHHFDQVLTGTRTVQRSREVIDHYELYYTYQDMGNGTFEEVPQQRPVYKTEYYDVEEPVYSSVPRYQTKYYFYLWQWRPVRDASSSGEDHNAFWPEVSLEENEREGQRSERYGFTITNAKGESTQYMINSSQGESSWMKLDTESEYQITSSPGGTVIADSQGNKIADIVQIR